jgi:hypothetical protein
MIRLRSLRIVRALTRLRTLRPVRTPRGLRTLITLRRLRTLRTVRTKETEETQDSQYIEDTNPRDISFKTTALTFRILFTLVFNVYKLILLPALPQQKIYFTVRFKNWVNT